jgi:hypothetical protein
VVAINAERSCRQAISDLLREPTRSSQANNDNIQEMKRPTRSQATQRTIFNNGPSSSSSSSSIAALPAGTKLVLVRY